MWMGATWMGAAWMQQPLYAPFVPGIPGHGVGGDMAQFRTGNGGDRQSGGYVTGGDYPVFGGSGGDKPTGGG